MKNWKPIVTRTLLPLFVIASFLAFLCLPFSTEVGAQGRSLTIIRDAEIETLLRDYAEPIFRAAAINPDSVEIVVVKDRSFNAFVTEGRKMFINAGALMDSETPNELIGVIAHEAGHIEGGHLLRLREEMANARMIGMLSMLLGAGAAVATSGSNIGGQNIGVTGIIAGGQEMALRTLSAYQRSEELSADRAGMRFLQMTGQSPDGMIAVLRRLGESAMFTATGRDRPSNPYLMSHPAPRDRIAQLERLVEQSPYRGRKDPPALQKRHDLARAKLFGFLDEPDSVNRRYHHEASSKAGRYARAIALHRSGRTDAATSLLDSLISDEPDSPYFNELKGQFLLESGRAAEAAPPLRKAVALSPNSASIRTTYGRALLANGRPGDIDAAIEQLTEATRLEPKVADAYRILGIAHGRRGDDGPAELASARFFLLTGDIEAARIQARRAMQRYPEGSVQWRRAKDIFDESK